MNDMRCFVAPQQVRVQCGIRRGLTIGKTLINPEGFPTVRSFYRRQYTRIGENGYRLWHVNPALRQRKSN